MNQIIRIYLLVECASHARNFSCQEFTGYVGHLYTNCLSSLIRLAFHYFKFITDVAKIL